MSFTGDPHDPRFELELAESVTLAALGEPVDAEFSVHYETCPQCQRELAALGHTVRIARECTEHRSDLDAVPPASVWTAIAAELDLGGQRHRHAAPTRQQRRRPRWRTALLAAAAAVALVLAGLGVGVLVGRNSVQRTPSVVSTARLDHMPGGPVAVGGTATVRSTSHGDELSVSTHGLPLREGYYEVWLFNPRINQMVALGTLADNGTGTFPIPSGLDPHAYHVADVSAQNYDGDAAHGKSVLRGAFAQ